MPLTPDFAIPKRKLPKAASKKLVENTHLHLGDNYTLFLWSLSL